MRNDKQLHASLIKTLYRSLLEVDAGLSGTSAKTVVTLAGAEAAAAFTRSAVHAHWQQRAEIHEGDGRRTACFMVSALLTYAATLGFDCGSDGVLRLNPLRCRWPTAPLHIYNSDTSTS